MEKGSAHARDHRRIVIPRGRSPIPGVMMSISRQIQPTVAFGKVTVFTRCLAQQKGPPRQAELLERLRRFLVGPRYLTMHRSRLRSCHYQLLYLKRVLKVLEELLLSDINAGHLGVNRPKPPVKGQSHGQIARRLT